MGIRSGAADYRERPIDCILERDRALRVKLLKDFFYDRARWGWSEFHAPGYALISTKALTLLKEFAKDNAYKIQRYRNPCGPQKGDNRALRGCGWNFDPH